MKIKFFDFFDSIVGLKYDGHWRYKSSVGGILFIITAVLCLTTVLYFSMKFFLREEPKMYFENSKFWNPPENNLTTGFSFAIMMKYQDINIIKPDIVKIEVNYNVHDQGKTKTIPLQKINCTKAMFDGSTEEFDSLELEKGICVDLSGISIQGSTVNAAYSYISIHFSLCMNQTGCYPYERLPQLFDQQKPLAVIYFKDAVFQVTQVNHVKHYIMSYDVNVTYSNSKSSNLYFSKNILSIDEGYFLNNSTIWYYEYMFDYFRDLVSVRTESQKESLVVNFFSSKNQQIIKVSYMQLSELLANIGALVNVIILFFRFLANYLNQYYFQNELINDLYFFHNEKQGLDNANDVIIDRNNLKAHSQPIMNNIIVNHHNDNKTNANLIYISKTSIFREPPGNIAQKCSLNEELINKALIFLNKNFRGKNYMNGNNDLKFSNCAIFLFALCQFSCCKMFKEKKNKFNLLDKKISILQEHRTIFKKVQEMDLIKYLILSEDQLNLYRLIVGNISLWEKLLHHMYEDGQKNISPPTGKEENKINENAINTAIKGSMMRICNKEIKTEIDQKLVQFFMKYN